MEVETKKCINFKRRGTFRISSNFIEETPLDILSQLFSKFVITRCEHLYSSQEFVYDAFCEEFDEIEPNLSLREYEIIFGKDGFKITSSIE